MESIAIISFKNLCMKKISLLCFAAINVFLCKAQENDTTAKIVQLEEVIFSANKFAEKKKNIAQKIDIISTRQIASVNAQNTGDLLMNTGNIFVQKSQQAGSSPVIRGFEASRVLLVVDGVRMNNAIYRSGHLQNVITVDQNMLERVEVLYGPASTIFGSDALGGVVLFRTKSPKLSSTGKLLTTGSSFVRYSSANDEKSVHADLSIGGKKFGWLQSYNFSNFGDMKMGDNYPSDYPDFGRRSTYVASINGIDSVINNNDDRLQRNSGYKQWDITQKLLYKTEKVSHLLNVQLSNSTDVPRYDRLQDIRNETLRYAEWYYGPQKRIFSAYELTVLKPGIFNEVRANINFQDIEESRHTRDYRRYDRLDSRIESIRVWGLTVDARKLWENHELTVGIDGQANDLSSKAVRQDILTGATTKLDTRYPDGKNNMNYAGLYAQHLVKLLDGKIVINDGIRFQYVDLHSTISDNSFFNFPYTDIRQDNFSVTGNIGLNFLPSDATKIALSGASGFRSPNIDDLAKIFESSTAAKQVIVPNPDIKPEYTYNLDLYFSHVIGGFFKIEAAAFYTWFRNALVKAPYQFNGQDSILYNGVLSQVLANQNRNEARVYGATATVSMDIGNTISVFSTINITRGNFDTNTDVPSNVFQKQPDGSYKMVSIPVGTKPLDHIPPVFGKTSVSFHVKRFKAELYCIYNGWKHLDDYNADGEDNPQYATVDGMPAWYTLNLKTRTNITQQFALQVGIENILDRNYRHFGSGFSAAGRNLILTGRFSF